MDTNQPGTREEILHDLLQRIGNLQCAVQGIQEQRKELITWMAKLDERLRLVERKAAINGLIAGGVMTMIMGIAGYFFKFQIGG